MKGLIILALDHSKKLGNKAFMETQEAIYRPEHLARHVKEEFRRSIGKLTQEQHNWLSAIEDAIKKSNI